MIAMPMPASLALPMLVMVSRADVAAMLTEEAALLTALPADVAAFAADAITELRP